VPKDWNKLNAVIPELLDEDGDIFDFINGPSGYDATHLGKTIEAIKAKDIAKAAASAVELRPSGADIKLRPSGADIKLRPSGADIKLRPSGADIKLRPSGADIELRPSGADIRPLEVSILGGQNDSPDVASNSDCVAPSPAFKIAKKCLTPFMQPFISQKQKAAKKCLQC
jgi:hypothetical protein